MTPAQAAATKSTCLFDLLLLGPKGGKSQVLGRVRKFFFILLLFFLCRDWSRDNS